MTREFYKLERKSHDGTWVIVTPQSGCMDAFKRKAALEKDNPKGRYRVVHVMVTEEVIEVQPV